MPGSSSGTVRREALFDERRCSTSGTFVGTYPTTVPFVGTRAPADECRGGRPLEPSPIVERVIARGSRSRVTVME